MRRSFAVPLLLLASGAGLLGWSVAQGGANVSLVVIFPVISGSSVPFLLGILLLVAGFFSLPFTLAGDEEWEDPMSSRGTSNPSPGERRSSGGFVLVGPIPIFFGTWKNAPTSVRWTLAVVGAVLLTVVIVAALLWIR